MFRVCSTVQVFADGLCLAECYAHRVWHHAERCRVWCTARSTPATGALQEAAVENLL